MSRALPTKAARKAEFDLKSAQLEVEIAHAAWQELYVPEHVVLPGHVQTEQTRYWQLRQAQLRHELASLRLAHIAEETRLAALKSASKARNLGAA
jgi:hypothetical protein